jgi:hypothetical protein
LSIASFATGSVLRYMLIYPELAVILIGFGADIVAVTNFFKKFADDPSDSVTSTFYYNCVIYTCLVIILGQFGVGVWFLIVGISELAITLITQAIVMTTLSVYLKKSENEPSVATTATATTTAPATTSLIPAPLAPTTTTTATTSSKEKQQNPSSMLVMIEKS